MKQILPWKSIRRISHPSLKPAILVISWETGRWVPRSLNYPNGMQKDGLTGLLVKGLELAYPFHPIPRLKEKD